MKNETSDQYRHQHQNFHDPPMIQLSYIDVSPIQSLHIPSERLGPSLEFDMWRSEADQADGVSQLDANLHLAHQMPSVSLANNPAVELKEEDDLSKQIDTVRRQWMSLKEKRRKKAELVQSSNEKAERTIGIFRRAKYSVSMSLQKFSETLKGFAYTFELWYSDLKLIEGNFGSGIAAYFKFLRWLFLLNFIMLIISFSFLALPQILSRLFVNFDDGVPSKNVSSIEYTDTFSNGPDSNSSQVTASAVPFVYKDSPYRLNTEFSVDNLFTGEGFFTQTSLYYGYYTNQTLELVEGYTYNIPNAYFFTLFVCYLLFFIVVSFSMARSYRTSFIETKGGHKNIVSLKVFCGWDFSIATQPAAALNHRHAYNEIKEVLNENADPDDDYSCFSLFTNALIHMSLNAMFILLLAGTGFLMWDLLGNHSTYIVKDAVPELKIGISYNMIMSIFISVVMNLFPKGFSWVVRYEGYNNPRTALFVTLLRTFILNVVVMGVLLVFSLQNTQAECWQTSLGQEVYRLLVTDFIVSILIMEVLQAAWSWVSKKCLRGSSCPEFDIASNSLNLIYNQTLLLVGLYFSPLLCAVVVLKLFITFYVRKVGMYFNAEASKSWRAAQTQTVYLILIFITTLGVFLMLAYILIEIPPSNCGPFQGNENTYRIVLDSILQLEGDHIFWKIVMFLVKPGIVAAVLVAMSAAAFILSVNAQAYTTSADILREMVISEAKDKAFLFKVVRRLERAGYKGGSAVSSSSSFSRTPLSERRLIRKRVGESSSSASVNSRTKVLADSSIPWREEPDDSPRGSTRHGHASANYIPQTVSSGTSRMTLESSFSEYDADEGHHLY